MKMTMVFKKLLFCVGIASAGLVLGQIAEEPRTPDGRAFSTLSNQELEKLSKRDQDAYEAWLDTAIARRKAEVKELEIHKAEQDAKLKELDEKIDALDKRLRNSPEAQLMKDYVVRAKRNEITASDVPPDVQAAMSRIAALTPPPQFILEVRAACDALGIFYKK